ncbi:Hypp6277 [Branchiostoma lanceolatum]|uniref:Hypp6277 protein n=1 Tax=Branchiostoma lanceolatum TaxID=7740 RepID=A0A8J9YRY3_BRALA|nr:Hypp6277 [Branchiostoma lanceolatum]
MAGLDIPSLVRACGANRSLLQIPAGRTYLMQPGVGAQVGLNVPSLVRAVRGEPVELSAALPAPSQVFLPDDQVYLPLLALCAYLYLYVAGVAAQVGLDVPSLVRAVRGEPVELSATFSSSQPVISIIWSKIEGGVGGKKETIFMFTPQSQYSYARYKNRVTMEGQATLKISYTEPEDEGLYTVAVVLDVAGQEEKFVRLEILGNQTTCIEDDDGNLLTTKPDILRRWKTYCQELYNYQLTAEEEVLEELKSTTCQLQEDVAPDILESEVVAAIKALKLGKSPGIDNVPGELLKAGGETVARLYTRICNHVFKTGKWPKAWTTSVVIPLPKKGNLKKCPNYRTISLISHPSKILLKVILNRLQPQAEQILSEEQAGFRKGRSCAEQIFNLRLICEKYRELGKPVYHTFVDYKKCFDRVWQDGLWAVMRRFNISRGIVNSIEALYKSSQSMVMTGGEFSECFPTSVGVRQGCLLSPTLCNIFLENIMREALAPKVSPIKLSGRIITHLQFADDVDLLDGLKEDQQLQTSSLDSTSRRYGMEISLEKTKCLVSGPSDTTAQVTVRGTELEQVSEFTYLGSVQTEDCGSTKEVKVRIAKSTLALSKLKHIWSSHNISMSTKIRLLRCLVLSIFLYGAESWTLNAEIAKRINAFEMNCYRRLLRVHWTSHTTNKEVKERIHTLQGPLDSFLSLVKKKKLQWFGHVSRAKGTLANTILQGKAEGARPRGRPRRSWISDLKEWTGHTANQMTRLAENRQQWRAFTETYAAPTAE